MLRFAHFNFNVLDLDKSLAFYRDALELSPVRTKEAADGSSSWCTWETGRPALSWS